MAPLDLDVALHSPPRDWPETLLMAANIVSPFVTALVAILIYRATKRLEHSQWRNQRLIEKRIDVWKEAGPLINRIYCYCIRVGDWKNNTPTEIVDLKRKADMSFHLSRPFFSDRFFACYMDFIDSCFETYQGHGVDAKLRTPMWEHRNASKEGQWQAEWSECFSEVATPEKVLHEKYNKVIDQLQKELVQS